MNLIAKLMVLLRQILFNLATAAIVEAILIQISAEQVPSLHRVAERRGRDVDVNLVPFSFR